MYGTGIPSKRGLGFVPLATAGISAASSLLGPLVGLFSKKPPYAGFKEQALPDMTARAKSSGYPTIIWWFDDIIRVDDQGNWSIIVPAERTRTWSEPDKMHQFTAAYDSLNLETYLFVNDNWALHEVGDPAIVRNVNPVDAEVLLPPAIINAAEQKADNATSIGGFSMQSILGGGNTSTMLLLGAGVLAFILFGRKR